MKTKIVRKSVGQEHVSLPKKSGSQEILLFPFFVARLQVSMSKNISTHVRPTHSENQEKVENELIFQAGTSCIDS